MAKEEKTRKRKKEGGDAPKPRGTGWLGELRYGRIVSLEFFKANAWLLMVAIVMVISLMGLRYKTRTKMGEIKQLSIELQRAESLKLQRKAEYMSLIRETEMRKLVEEKGLDLEFQEQPPYELSER